MRMKQRAEWCAAASMFVMAVAGFPTAEAAENGKFRLGIVTFLSGPASGPFGVPAENAAKVTIAALNAGKLPEPYAMKGINGVEIETVLVDEAGGASKQVEEFRNLVERQKVDAVIGYISSGDCLAVAPVAEELKALTIFFDCGTPRIFEDASYKYVFRTGPIATTDNIGAARYVFDTRPATKSIAGINQNYAWGQDSWNDFKAAMQVLVPQATVKTEQFPKLGAGQYGAELSAILVGVPISCILVFGAATWRRWSCRARRAACSTSGRWCSPAARPGCSGSPSRCRRVRSSAAAVPMASSLPATAQHLVPQGVSGGLQYAADLSLL